MSRGSKNGIIFVLVGVLLPIMVVVDRQYGGKLRERVSEKAAGGDIAKYHRKSFRIGYIVDGDTVDIDIADGEYERTRVRLLGVDTPETKSRRVGVMYYGKEATEFVTQLTMGKEVTVLIDSVSDTRDRYNRLLAYLQFSDGKVLNEELIRNGFGYADLRFDHSDFQAYAKLQDEALKCKKMRRNAQKCSKISPNPSQIASFYPVFYGSLMSRIDIPPAISCSKSPAAHAGASLATALFLHF